MLEDEVATRLTEREGRAAWLTDRHRTVRLKIAKDRLIQGAAALTGSAALLSTTIEALQIASVAGFACGAALVADAILNARRSRETVMGTGQGPGNDPDGAMTALDALLGDLRAASDPRRLQRAYEQAVDGLQALIPGRPLANLVRYGYLPSRPQYTENNRIVIVNNDDDPRAVQWERTVDAAEQLRRLLGRRDAILTSEAEKALAKLVPPLRSVLRETPVATHRLEYSMRPQGTPAGPRTPPAIGDVPGGPGSAIAIGHVEASPFDAVRDRLNASATMTAAAIDTLAAALRNADPGLFDAGDRETGELMLDKHLPRLNQALLTADDAATGEERDEIRADYAKALKTMREQLEGVMGRHARTARDLLRDQTRFIEARHGATELDPDARDGEETRDDGR